jgi:uncharacterized protein YegJ (DUF2314 family)
VLLAASEAAMEAAVREARARLPEFIAAFEARRPGESFAVKARFVRGDEAEHMWVMVEAVEGDRLYGRLGNEPVSLTHLRPDERLGIAFADLEDWLHVRDGEFFGGFTNRALKDAPPWPGHT